MSRRVFGIGLDGATFDLLDPWMGAGELPVLDSLLKRGVRGKLLSTTPPMSPQAWTSFMTGRNPGKHGVYDFVQLKPGSYDLYFCNASTRRCDSIWRVLSDAGRTVGVVNVPMTYPPEPVRGFMVSGMEAPGVASNYTHPAGLADELRRVLGGYDMHGDYWTRASPEQYLERVMQTVENQSRAIRYLMQRDEWDLFFAVFGSTDRVQHFFWRYMDPSHPRYDPQEAHRLGDAVLRVYRRIDELLGEYVGLLPPNTTRLLMSDHGAGPFERIVHLDAWLKREGYLRYRKEMEGATPRALAFDAFRRAYVAARRLLPRGLKDWLKARLPDTRTRIESRLMMAPIDWSRTRAFYLGIESTRIFINVRGRFPQGTVGPGAEYESLRREIMEKLTRLRDPQTGEAVVESARRGEDVYWGDALDEAPDILVLWRGDRYITRKGYGTARGDLIVDDNLRSGEVGALMSLEQTGTHRPHGILHIQGEGLRDDGGEIDGAEITDLAPTLLYLFGVPVPSDMDGKVLEDAIDPAYMAQHPVEYGEAAQRRETAASRSVYSGPEAAGVGERLRNLGYIE